MNNKIKNVLKLQLLTAAVGITSGVAFGKSNMLLEVDAGAVLGLGDVKNIGIGAGVLVGLDGMIMQKGNMSIGAGLRVNAMYNVNTLTDTAKIESVATSDFTEKEVSIKGGESKAKNVKVKFLRPRYEPTFGVSFAPQVLLKTQVAKSMTLIFGVGPKLGIEGGEAAIPKNGATMVNILGNLVKGGATVDEDVSGEFEISIDGQDKPKVKETFKVLKDTKIKTTADNIVALDEFASAKAPEGMTDADVKTAFANATGAVKNAASTGSYMDIVAGLKLDLGLQFAEISSIKIGAHLGYDLGIPVYNVSGIAPAVLSGGMIPGVKTVSNSITFDKDKIESVKAKKGTGDKYFFGAEADGIDLGAGTKVGGEGADKDKINAFANASIALDGDKAGLFVTKDYAKLDGASVEVSDKGTAAVWNSKADELKIYNEKLEAASAAFTRIQQQISLGISLGFTL